MEQRKTILTIIVLCSILYVLCFTVFAASDSVNVIQRVVAECNNDGVCNSDLGETYENCPSDCPAPPPPPPPPPPSPTSAPALISIFDTIPPVIYNLLISKVTLNSADIYWETNELTYCQLFWGKTQEYEIGAASENSYYFKHSSRLTELSPSTTYHFKISCHDTYRNVSETKEQKFTTLTPPDITPPANISNFEAIPKDSQIILKWQNPTDLDFKAVKILRSEKFYPRDPWEGYLIYDDKGTSFVDTGLKNGVRYYYTAFSYDFAGNFSSGATVTAVPFKTKPPLPPKPPSPPAIKPLPEKLHTEKECSEAGFYWYDNACHLRPKIFPLPPMEKIALEDFDFIQDGKKIPVINNKIKIKSGELLTISIDYKKVSIDSKTIMATLKKDDKFLSFLLRANKERTAYLATFLSPEAGAYSLTIVFLNYKNQVIKEISGQLEIFEAKPPSVPSPWYKNIINFFLKIWHPVKNFFRKVF
jgi:hypothetical protein